MTPDFYADMKSRAGSIAMMAEFFDLLETKRQTLEKYGLQGFSVQVLFLFFVLRWLMDKTLADRPATFQELVDFLLELNRDLFRQPWSERDAAELTHLVINQILLNKGEPVLFDPVWEDGDWHSYVSYITSSLDEAAGTVHYSLGKEGMRLLLLTRELEDNLKIQVSDIIAQMRYAKKDYGGTLEEIRSQLQRIRIKEMDLKERITSIRTDALAYSIQEFKDLYEEDYGLLETARKKFADFGSQVDRDILQAEETFQSAPEDEKTLANLQALRQIRQALDSSLVAFSRLLGFLSGFSVEVNEILDQQLAHAGMRRHSFRRMVYEPILDQPRLLDAMDQYLHPLFLQAPAPAFQLNHAFQYKRILVRSEEDSFEDAEKAFDQEAYSQMLAEQKETLDRYQKAVQELLDQVEQATDHTLDLTALLANPVIFPSLDQTRLLLGLLAGNRICSLVWDEDLVLEDSQEFNLGLSLLQAAKNLPAPYTALEIRKGEGKARKTFQEEGMQFLLETDNLEFVLKGEAHA